MERCGKTYTIKTTIVLWIAVAFVLAAALCTVLINHHDRERALKEARDKAWILLEQNQSLLAYFRDEVRAKVIDMHRGVSPDVFDPALMSSFYTIRRVNEGFNKQGVLTYRYKICAINARTPEDEADPYEAGIIEAFNARTDVKEHTAIRDIEGKPYYVIMRPGGKVSDACKRCHSTPEAAPKELVARYGDKGGYSWPVNQIVSAYSIRIPMAEQFHEANMTSAKLSAAFAAILVILYCLLAQLGKRLVFDPLNSVRSKAIEISGSSDEHLGEEIPLPSGRELLELTSSFNAMSKALRSERDFLEKRVELRTEELRMASEALKAEVAERKATEEALRRSEANLQVIIESTADGILAVDENGKVVRTNRRFAELWRIPQSVMDTGEDEALLRSILDQLVDPDAFLEKVMSLYGSSELSKDLLFFRDGRVFERYSAPLLREDAIIGRVWSFRDTTQSKQMEETLRESEAFLTTIFENIPNMIFVKDAEELRFVRFNKAGEDLLGHSREELIGKSDYDFFPKEEADFFTKSDREVLESGIVKDISEEPIETKRNGTRILHTKKLAVYSKEGAPQYLLGISEDITDKKRAEEEIRSYMVKLEQSNQALQQFASIASHDLQEPLRTVSSFVQLLERRYRGKLDADADEFISYVIDGARRMQSLINDLLAYSRVETQGSPFEPTDMEVVFKETIAGMKASIEESGALISSDPLPKIPADPSQMIQLLQNLIGNGLKFRSEKSPQIHISAKPLNGEWLFSVKDNGIGIDEKFSERIFRIFQRLHTREEYPGTGIGLAICKKIIDRHGGRIWLESQEGVGSTFFFAIPAH